MDYLTPDQRAAYFEAARAHSIPALAAMVLTMIVAVVAFGVQLLGGDA
jgi:hypothetical protein